jgi:hypothetical protein
MVFYTFSSNVPSNAHHLLKLKRWFSASPRGRGMRAAPASAPASVGMAGLLRPSHWTGVSSGKPGDVVPLGSWDFSAHG